MLPKVEIDDTKTPPLLLLYYQKNNNLEYFHVKKNWEKTWFWRAHSLIRVVLIQSCSARAKNFTNYIFCHPKFSGVIQNIENCCAIRAIKFDFWLYKIDYLDNSWHRQTGVKMAQWFSIFWITPLNYGWQNI